ncbi:hypothetical protein BBJ29_006942 [Phytophthora kernoviae]|uniref:Uncharacterized protein n=1 Tax=Phytophthora kernoviae TaxID=325452 RepID=A0A3F2RU94_9STRA|nr:hypothetical protein BBJ29_006942 [Phytophthora kernoviae]RLN64328.1 hypothetical protein BBP00_00003524 [Phytophthora kernoviae]
MGMRAMCAAGVALATMILMLLAAILRITVLLVQMVTLRYTFALCALLISVWFLDSRRRRYARGFYSCSQVPQTERQEQARLEEKITEEEKEEEEKVHREKTSFAAVAPVAPVEAKTAPEQLKKVATAPPSETESEDDDSEATDTGTTNDKHKERSRRATFASKQDVYMAAGRSSSEMLEDALRSDGYWIGDFSVQRRLVARRSHASSPKAN